MPEATNTPTTSRAVVSVIADCEAHTDMLHSTARLIDHLRSSEQTIQGRDLEPLQFVIERSAGALEMRWSPVVGQFGDLAKLGSGSPQAANRSFSPLHVIPAA